MNLTIRDIVTSISTYNEECLIFAKRIDGKFLPNSHALVIELTDGEKELQTHEIAALKCPGFEYFLDVFIINDMISDFENSNDPVSLDQRLEIIIHYAEFDA